MTNLLEKLDISDNALGRSAILCATIIWGSSFVFMKNAVNIYPPYFIMAIRFTLAPLILMAIFYKKVHKINKSYIKGAVLVGTSTFIAYGFQSYGLIYTTPGKNAFLTAGYCVLTPFCFWLIRKIKPTLINIIAAVICFIGIGFLSLNESFTLQLGDGLTLGCTLFFAFQVVFIRIFSGGKDPMMFTAMSFIPAAIEAWIATLIVDSPLPHIAAGDWPNIIYLTVFCSAAAFALQTIGQYKIPASQSALLLCTESVFGVLFSVALYNEIVSFKMFIGFLLIFASVVMSEAMPLVLDKRRKKINHKN